MQRSEELPNTAKLMFQQLQVLGVPQFGCSFNIWDDDRKASTSWGQGKMVLHHLLKHPVQKIFLFIFLRLHKEENLYLC
jgi:hypothetical protein